jgi:hypothetical protein
MRILIVGLGVMLLTAALLGLLVVQPLIDLILRATP